MKSGIIYGLLLGGVTLLNGDESFPEVYNSEADKSAEPPAAEEALGMMALPDGFEATVFAAEPDVRNPIAMTWDGRGRLWVAENYTYAEKATRFELSLKDRVLIFEDTDWDGKADKRTVFEDDLQMLTSVEVGRGGVWLMCPPQLLFIPDKNGDDIPDGKPEVVLDGFEIGLTSYHNFANGLRWGPDSWLYGRCGHSCPGRVGVPGTPDADRIAVEGGIWRYHPETKVFESLTHGTTNPWGHDWDQHGELFFINTVNNHLWHGIHGAHFTESFGADPNPLVFERIDGHADHFHFDTNGKWSESRNGAANAFGGGHAHIGMMIYQGEQWPEYYRNKLYTMNMHGLRTNVERLEREGSGFFGRHEPDIFITEDTWFRGIDIRVGPDGSAFIIDWSDTGECHEHTGVHRTSGRIYRVSYGTPSQPDLSAAQEISADFLACLNKVNPWDFRRLLERIALEGPDESLKNLCLGTLEGDADVVAQLRALWLLHGMGESAHLENLVKHRNEAIRAWALRLLTDDSPLDTIMGPLSSRPPKEYENSVLAIFAERAQLDDSGLVRLTLASILQRLPLDERETVATILAAREEDVDDYNLPEMVWYGICPLTETNPDALVRIAKASKWPDLHRWIARALTSHLKKDPTSIDDLLTWFPEADASVQLALLEGTNEATRGWRAVSKPGPWDAVVAEIEKSNNEMIKSLGVNLSVGFGDGRALDEIKVMVKDRNEDINARIAALETLIESRPEDLREICEPLLKDKVMNGTAVRGLALFDDPRLGEVMVAAYSRFYPTERPKLIEVLVSRPAWSAALLRKIKSGEISKTNLSAFQARQILSFEDAELTQLLEDIWGDVRVSSEEKRKLIEEWTAKLDGGISGEPNLGKGRELYAMICGACHIMYGKGGRIGPDLTGSNRHDLSYLLENIIDPGAVVSSEYRMSIFEMKDGRIMTGVVAAENDNTVTLQQMAEETVVEKSVIKKRSVAEVSMMPEGLLQPFSDEQVRDLIAYLRHPGQVPLP